MKLAKTSYNRRSFLKASALGGGGMILAFSWMAACTDQLKNVPAIPEDWFDLNAYLKIGSNGTITIVSPNPEGGQNIKTSMPMIVAEELDVDWKDVLVEQAPLNTELYTRQFIGGSQAIRRGWQSLRMAGATARHMLREAAASTWGVPVEEVSTEAGILYHKSSSREASYGEMASAAVELPVPEEVVLKKISDFSIIGTSRKNVDTQKIVTGEALFGIDHLEEGMLIAMIVHPPAFGMKLASVDDAKARSMPGIKDVFPLKVLDDDFERQHFDTCTFLEVVAIVGESTWAVMQAKKALDIKWEAFDTYTEQRTPYGRSAITLSIPAGLENSDDHRKQMKKMAAKPGQVVRKDGNPEAAFKKAEKIIERSYSAPFLAHNCMEPMNFFAHVT